MLFSYTGFDQYRIKRKGYIRAENKRDAIHILKMQGIVAIMHLEETLDIVPINKVRDKIMTLRENQWEKEKEKIKNKKDTKREKNASFISLKNSIQDLLSGIKFKEDKNEVVSEKDFQYFKNLFNKMEEYEEAKEFQEKRKYEEVGKEKIIVDNSKTNAQAMTLNWDKIKAIESSDAINSKKLKIKDKEMLSFMRRLKTMRQTDIPILKALTLLQNGASEDMQFLLQSVKEDVEKGESLAYAFGKFPYQLSSLHISLIDIGEESGELVVALDYIIDDIERNLDMKSKLKNASIYPSIVLGFVVILLLLGSIFLIPKMEELFFEMSDGKAELPGLTKVVFAIGKSIPYVFFLLLSFFLIIKFFGDKTPRLRAWFYEKISVLKLKVPIVSPVIKMSYMYTIASTLSIMMKSNIKNTEALRFTMNSINNIIVQKEINDTLTLIESQSLPLHEAFAKQEHIDAILISMAETGYETGELEESLSQAADLYLDELDAKIADLSEALGPTLMILLAAIVVPVILSLYMLLFGMQDLLA